MTDAAQRTVLLETTASGVAIATLNRPERLNAMSEELLDDLAEMIERVDGDRAIACLIITGAGRGFCAGGDVQHMAARDRATAGSAPPEPGTELEAWEDRTRQTRRMHARIPRRLYELAKPTLALVNGPAAGAGLGLACACDFRFASDRAVFTTAFAQIGRSGDFGTSFFLRQLVGPTKARALYFTAEQIDAQTALALGIVSAVYPHDELLARGLAFAEQLAAGPVRAFGRMKQALRVAPSPPGPLSQSFGRGGVGVRVPNAAVRDEQGLPPQGGV
jgi:2-(1,2-epoxy-1,2-dihydrophenyl)acetyl-CoA isomerase